MRRQTEKQKQTDFWKEIIRKWRRSGKSKKRFCEDEGLSYWTFRDKLKITEKEDKGFVRVAGQISTTDTSVRTIELCIGTIKIHLAEGYDSNLLRSVIIDLESIAWR
jgi:hypothetical protein